MEWLTSLVGGFVLLIVANGVLRTARAVRRTRSKALAPGETPLHTQAGLPARIFTNQRLPGGLKPRVINRDRVDLQLTGQRLVACSGAGRILEITRERPGSVRAVGPGRLVLEGTHPSNRGTLRVELVCADAEDWAAWASEQGLQGASPAQML